MNENREHEKPFQTPPDLRYIAVKDLHVNPNAQRKFNQSHADKIMSKFDPDLVDIVKVSERTGRFSITDGMHTTAVLGDLFGEDFKVLCHVRITASEKRDAQLFLGKNDQLTVSAMDKFLVGVTAGQIAENEINRVVEDLGLAVNRTRSESTVGAIGALRRVHKQGGKPLLRRTLYVLNEAYGIAGMDRRLIDGMSHVLARYNEDIEDDAMIYKLKKVEKGVSGLLGEIASVAYATHKPIVACVSAVLVNTYNTGRGTRKLPPYWAA